MTLLSFAGTVRDVTFGDICTVNKSLCVEVEEAAVVTKAMRNSSVGSS